MVDREQCGNKVLGVLGDEFPRGRGEFKLAATDTGIDVRIGLAVEGSLPGEHHVGDDADGPDVALFVVVGIEHLGCDIERCAEDLLKTTLALLVVRDGRSKVNDLHFVEVHVRLEEDILGLQISVYDSLSMAVVNAGEHGLDQDTSSALLEFSRLDDGVEELTAGADLLHEAVVSGLVVELVEADNVGMVHF